MICRESFYPEDLLVKSQVTFKNMKFYEYNMSKTNPKRL